jgi:hypothetical protein
VDINGLDIKGYGIDGGWRSPLLHIECAYRIFWDKAGQFQLDKTLINYRPEIHTYQDSSYVPRYQAFLRNGQLLCWKAPHELDGHSRRTHSLPRSNLQPSKLPSSFPRPLRTLHMCTLRLPTQPALQRSPVCRTPPPRQAFKTKHSMITTTSNSWSVLTLTDQLTCEI